MLPNARELCEQLRLILEPTKCTRLKGDYRTGRRINMKKVKKYNFKPPTYSGLQQKHFVSRSFRTLHHSFVRTKSGSGEPNQHNETTK